MRVAMYYNNRDVRIEEMPVPEIGQGEILVKVMASGICGSDVLEWYRIKKAPLVLGHEITGEICGVGEKAGNYRVGERVFVSHHVPCNTCHYCLNNHHTACDTLHKTNYFPGGNAQYLRIPEINVDRGMFRLPDSVSYADGTFIEPLACVVRGQRLADIALGQTVLIIGSGISGLLHIMLARACGVGKIIATDVSDFRLNMARQFGADEVINAKEDLPKLLRQLNDNRLADRVIICTGALSAMNQALESVDRGGKVLFFAVPEPGKIVPVAFDELWRNEITLMTSYGASSLDIVTATELIRAGRINVSPMISHRLSLGEAELGFKLVAEAKESLKVILEPQR